MLALAPHFLTLLSRFQTGFQPLTITIYKESVWPCTVRNAMCKLRHVTGFIALHYSRHAAFQQIAGPRACLSWKRGSQTC